MKLKLEQISKEVKCEVCDSYTIDEIPNIHTTDPHDSTKTTSVVNRKYLRKFRCRRCLAEFREVDKEKELSPMEKYIEEQRKK